MAFTSSGFKRTLTIAVILALVFGIGASLFFNVSLFSSLFKPAPDPESPEALAAEALEALTAVRNRDLKATLRPARYDAILRPIDKLLSLAKNLEGSEEFDPIRDFNRIQSYTDPVIAITEQAHAQAQSETSFLKKDYRFMDQKGEACRLLAAAMWNRLETEYRRSNARSREYAPFVPSTEDSERLYAVLNSGLDAAPENKFLWHLRSVVRRANGSFVAAESDLRKAIELDEQFVAAWNDLGLVLINLRRFDEAETALLRARQCAANAASAAQVDKGIEYITATLNLARFHEALTDFFRHEARIEPTPDNRTQLERHSSSARMFLQEVISLEPPDSPDRREAEQLLQGLAY